MFQPQLYFFYGSLMSPQVLKNILELPELPCLSPASVLDYELKACGHYLAAIRVPGHMVHGMVYLVQSQEEVDELQDYESSAYDCSDVWIMTSEGEAVSGKMFLWKGDVDALDDAAHEQLKSVDQRMLERGYLEDAYWQLMIKKAAVTEPESHLTSMPALCQQTHACDDRV